MTSTTDRGAGRTGRCRIGPAATCLAALAALLASAAGPASAADPAPGVFSERREAVAPDPAGLRALSAGDYAAMDAGRARELLSAVTVTREGVVGRREAAAGEVGLFLAESRRLARAAAGRAGAAEAEGASPEVVIGPDQRARVTDTRRPPFRSVGRVELGCTGTLVGPRHVLTAAHCVYDLDSGQWLRLLDFSPAQNGSLRPYGTVSWVRALAPVGYTRDRLLRFDYALIVLSRPVAAAVARLPLEARSGLAGLAISVAGYPGDKPFGQSWRSSCRAEGVRRNGQLFYDCDTTGGMSGSPVLAATSGGRSAVVAVHGYGYRNDAGVAVINAGAPVTAAVRRQVQAWIAAN